MCLLACPRIDSQTLRDQTGAIWRCVHADWVTVGKCGSSQNAVRHVDEKKERENDKAKDRVRLQSLSLTAVVVVLVRGDYE